MADARSEQVRKGVHDWYTGTCYNRLEKGGKIVLINHQMHQDDLTASRRRLPPPKRMDHTKYCWIDDDGREIPIVGAFDAENRMKGAKHFRERVHFLGLVAEEIYERDELQYFIRFYHNPHLFSSMAEAIAVLRSFPLYQPQKTRERRPDLFLHEVFKVDGAAVQFGIVVGGKTVLCRVHRDTLEDLEQKGIEVGSEEMIRTFHRHEDALRELALEKAKRELVKSDGAIFIGPDDLKLNEPIDLIDTFPADSDTYDALVKLKLVHAPGRSVLMPDQLVLVTEGVWLQPQFFTAPTLSFREGMAYAQFGVDLPDGESLLVGVTNDRHVRALPDGSHIYRCRIAGPAALAGHAAGTCRIRTDTGFDMRLFHHTGPDTLRLIKQSSVLRGSIWNYQGTTKLQNVCYAYLTSLAAIRSDEDLQKIAMASDGAIAMLLDDREPPDGAVPIEVYRESTLNRTATLPLWIPSEALSPSHVWMHAPSTGPVYYEIANPAIFRIGLKPGEAVPIVGTDSVEIREAILKRFQYVVIGDSTDPIGITAPFNEEDTSLIFKIEDCAGSDPLTFWRENANTDLFSGRNVELRRFDRS
jgi:hypothetical protein